jgi:hypothetical protein
LKEPHDREEIRRRITRRQFPATNGLRVLSSVVAKCWDGEFDTMAEVRRAIETEMDGNRNTAIFDVEPSILPT